jgi:AraC family transcriptional regulator of adaptative response/methylated-DNA-[protein]-cysteine methyltransferase
MSAEDYRRIESAIRYIEANFTDRPTLDEMARRANLSKYHFDRLFKRWAGISPIQFMHFLTLDYTKAQLSASKSVLESALDAGISGAGRLHDLFVTFEAMTPGEFKRRGAGLEISYGFYDSPFGECIAAATSRGLCRLGFVESGGRQDALRDLTDTWPGARLTDRTAELRPAIDRIFAPREVDSRRPFNLHVRGTNFQVQVWKALLSIPPGCVVSYGDIAALLGRPNASRAVGGAVAINPVGYLIPCHRVIASTGTVHRYRWGTTRKRAMIGWEAAGKAR